ncbi:MAG: M48 family metallopeptidase [Actinomycetia bacterium]|nr:M48 family metallopeptidase [Actinomycetes bacterium]
MADGERVTPRVTAAWVFVLVVVVLVGAAALLVPWGSARSATGSITPDATLDFSAAEIALGDRLARLLVVPGLTSMGVSLGLTLVLGLTPLGARIASAVARPLGGGWFWQASLGGLLLLLIVRLATLPFGAWAESVRRSNGLSTRTWPGWALDVAKGFGVSALLTLVALTALIGLARRWPDWWWVAGGLGAALLVVTVSFAYPLVVEPLFNSFTPMPDGALRTSLLALAEEDGVTVDDVLVADASRRTSTLNAYVSGFGSSRRIVVYDNLLEQAPDAEVEAVVAHELGHAADRDVVTGTVLGALGAMAVVVLLYLVSGWLPLERWFGISGIGDGRSMAFLLAFVAVISFVSTPVQSEVSRQLEARADQHALDLTKDPQTFAEMQRRLATASKSDVTPNRALTWWFGTHPTAAARLAAARAWALTHPGVIAPGPLAPDRVTDVTGEG